MIGRILHQTERVPVRTHPRIDLASKHPPGGAKCEARHDAPDILPDTSPAFRPLFARGQDAHGIFGEVKNLGDQSVVKLALLFELLDAASKPIAEHEWMLVVEGADDGPLKSNYTRPFGFSVERPPSDWSGVRGSVKLARLSRDGARFADEKTAQAASPSGK